MKITELTKKLNAIKKKHGDVEVFLDLKSMNEWSDHGEYSHEPQFDLKVEKIQMLDMDNCLVSKKKHTVVSILMDF